MATWMGYKMASVGQLMRSQCFTIPRQGSSQQFQRSRTPISLLWSMIKQKLALVQAEMSPNRSGEILSSVTTNERSFRRGHPRSDINLCETVVQRTIKSPTIFSERFLLVSLILLYAVHTELTFSNPPLNASQCKAVRRSQIVSFNFLYFSNPTTSLELTPFWISNLSFT